MHSRHQPVSLPGPAAYLQILRLTVTGLMIASLVLLAPVLPAKLLPDDIAAPVSAAFLLDYSVEGYRIDCDIQADSSIQVTESINLKYLLDSESIALKLPLDGATALNLKSVAISADTSTGGAVKLMEVLPAESSKQASSQTLTYTYAADNDPRRLRISAFAASGTLRKLVVKYELQGALVRIGDTIEMRRTFFSSLGRKAITEPILMLHYPDQVNAEDALFQVISTVPFLATQVDPQTVQMSTTKLNRGQSMEAVLLLPDSSLSVTLNPQLQQMDRTSLFAGIEQEAQRVARGEQLDRLLSSLIWILVFVAVLLIILLVLIFDREGLIPSRRSIEPPRRSAFRPAILARLLRHHHPGQLLLGTLLDLVQRGKLRLDGQMFSLVESSPADYRGMAAFEIFLVQWLFERVNRGSTISTAQIRKYALNRRTAPEFAAYYDQLIKLVSEEMVSSGLIDLDKNRRGKLIGISLGSAYTVLAILISWLIFSFSGLVLLLPAAGFFFYGLKIRHLTGEGNLQANIGRVFRKTLIEFAPQTGADNLDPEQVAANLPQALTLGLTQRYVKQIEQTSVNKPELIGLFLRNFTQSMIAADPAIQLQNFARDLRAMESMLSASLYFALGIHFYE